jgi:CheY-specific phosphatase CheX
MTLGVWTFLSSYVIQSFSIAIIIGLAGLLIGKVSYSGKEDDL